MAGQRAAVHASRAGEGPDRQAQKRTPVAAADAALVPDSLTGAQQLQRKLCFVQVKTWRTCSS